VQERLELARGMLERDRVKSGSILLVSDLETAPDDVPALSRTVRSLRESSIELRVVALAPSTDARLIFEGLLEEEAVFDAPSPADELPASADDATRELPLTLLVLGAFLFLALAAHERLGGRLALTRGEEPAS
jgi:hypothetical protein